ncbi:SDR family oxidoreductase [Kitasatospora sp. NBC_01287]|uniref:SDR family oxidoreductase n=1 Tax=Kitasatospora sp. NBC_01287 TaxID=2903573 RepID=UPI00225A2426|nr:SDR family oxidoreductase [Kitasatospora sp. NBC_01287]MCX4745052.1 SDR family oxidoreductase [Kitasatospora sp. NBC_01287]
MTVLLTGATGFLGAALANRLLTRGHTLRCVVRGATDEERRAKLHAALPDADQRRLEVVAGDLAARDLGRSAAELAALGQGVTHVVHCGARVNMTLPYTALHRTNVGATETLLSLAETASAAFCYVGSLAAVARTVTGEPFELIDPVSGGYGQSKWAADRLVSVAHQEGRVRAVILRPGRATADSRTALGNPDDLLEQVLRLCLRLGVAPALETGVRLSPVDWMAELAVLLAERAPAQGRAYHLVRAESLRWGEVLDVLREVRPELARLPYPSWRELVTEAGRTDPGTARLATSLPPQPLVFDGHPANRPTNARRTLTDAHPEPPAAEMLLRASVAVWERDRP